MVETVETLVLALCTGGIGAAVISALHDRWKFQATQKAKKTDQTDEIAQMRDSEGKRYRNLAEKLEDIEQQTQNQSEALKLILLDRILDLGKSYIADGQISFDDRRHFHALHDCYHSGLGGNGDADFIVKEVDELDTK